MLRFIGTLLLLLPLVSPLGVWKLDDCPENSVCAVFLEDKCTIDGELSTGRYIGVIFDNNTRSQCLGGAKYGDLWARIDFEFLSGKVWAVEVISQRSINAVRFIFEHAELSFSMDKKTWNNASKLTWNNAGKEGEAHFPVWYQGFVERGPTENNFARYKFNISANGKRLINLLSGANLTLAATHHYFIPVNITLSDQRFAQLLIERSGNSTGDDTDEFTGQNLELWLGICGGFLFVVIVLVTCILMRKRKRADLTDSKSCSKKQEDEPKMKKFFSLFKKSASVSTSENCITPAKKTSGRVLRAPSPLQEPEAPPVPHGF